MNSFPICGSIIDDSSLAWAAEDVCPSKVRDFLAALHDGEEAVFEISSPGGSVTAGIAIANLIREAAKTRTCKARVVGIAASMASVIACACDEIEMDASAFFMVHNPWTVTEGDADDLRKSAELLDQMKSAILSFYRSKFDRTDAELAALMDAETWFTGEQAADFGFKASVVASDAPLRAAACARRLPNFAKAPAAAEHLFVLAEEKPTEDPPKEETPAEEPPKEEQPAPTEEPKPAEEPPKNDEFTARLAAAMKSRDTEINELKAKVKELQVNAEDVASKIEKDLRNQLDAKDKELTKAKAEVTRLAAALDSVKGELSETASALATTKDALATLNANVLTPSATATRSVNARTHLASLPNDQRAQFYLDHKAAVDNNQTVNV